MGERKEGMKRGEGRTEEEGKEGDRSPANHIPLILPVVWFLGFVGFDAPDVVRCALHQLTHQFIGLSLHRETA